MSDASRRRSFASLRVCGYVLIGALAALVWSGVRFDANDVLFGYKQLALTIAPSAERAYAYAEGYFNAREEHAYDIGKADRLFRRARALDPQHPLVSHELARIEFLKGNLPAALSLIEAQIRYHPAATPSSYYIRGLIEGYMGKYAEAAEDYERYLASDPHNWAAINDYAWVLLKADRAQDAVVATAGGLQRFPDNPWLLTSNAIGLYEMGLIDPAREVIRKAARAARFLSVEDWLLAYPGNDPQVAAEGLTSFQDAIITNMHTIILADTQRALQ